MRERLGMKLGRDRQKHDRIDGQMTQHIAVRTGRKDSQSIRL